MNWKEIYTSKLKSMEDAVKVVKSGDKVVIGHAVGEPIKLVDSPGGSSGYRNLSAGGYGAFPLCPARHGKTFQGKQFISWGKDQGLRKQWKR